MSLGSRAQHGGVFDCKKKKKTLNNKLFEFNLHERHSIYVKICYSLVTIRTITCRVSRVNNNSRQATASFVLHFYFVIHSCVEYADNLIRIQTTRQIFTSKYIQLTRTQNTAYNISNTAVSISILCTTCTYEYVF